MQKHKSGQPVGVSALRVIEGRGLLNPAWVANLQCLYINQHIVDYMQYQHYQNT